MWFLLYRCQEEIENKYEAATKTPGYLHNKIFNINAKIKSQVS